MRADLGTPRDVAALAAAAGELRECAARLRRLVPEVAGVLAGARAADTPRAWRSPWRIRCAARLDDWQRALDVGAGVLRDRAGLLDWLAERYDERAHALRLGLGAAAVVSADELARLRRFDASGGVGNDPRVWMLAHGLATGGVEGDAGGREDLPGAIGGSGDAGDAGGRPAVKVPIDETVLFDPVLLGVLSDRLRAAGDRSAALARAVAADGGRLSRLPDPFGGVDWSDPHCLFGERKPSAPAGLLGLAGSSGRDDPVGFGLHAVAVGAPAMARGIDRRMARFAAAELVARIGTDPATVTVNDLTAISVRLAGLSAAMRQAVISRLRGRPLAVLAAVAARVIENPSPGILGYLPALADLTDALIAGASSAMIGDVLLAFPWLEPGYPVVRGRPGEVVAVDRTGDPTVRDGISPSDVGQGGVADCYLVAALIGIARQDPGLLAERLRANPNGTVTIIMHPRGPAGAGVGVTVTASLPARRVQPPYGRSEDEAPGPRAPGTSRSRAAGYEEVAMDGDDAAGRPELWPALYEKAYARLHGGYPAIEFGNAATALRTLTGRSAHVFAAHEATVPALGELLADGEVVIVTTRRRTRPGGLVAAHAYTLLAVDVARRRVLLRNPWDPAPGQNNERWYAWDGILPDTHAVVHGPTR